MTNRLTRREALGLLGAGAAVTLAPRLAVGARGPQFEKGAIIRTILKDMNPVELGNGATLFHEHISINDPRPSFLPPMPAGRGPMPPAYGGKIDLMVDEVKALRTDGVSCIVNGGTIDLGMNPDHLKEIATKSGFPIAMAGGYYLHSTYPPEVGELSEDALAAKLVSDATAQRWGAFGEIGVSQKPMFPDEQKVLRAVCKAHLQTGLPIFTHNPHTGCGPCGLEQADIIESMKVNPAHVTIGHLADLTDDPKAETQKNLAKRGFFLGFDTVGRRLTQGDAKKLEMVLAVLNAGYEDHVLLGSDFATEDELKANHGNGFDTALIMFVPKMRNAGVKPETIHKITVDNPRRFLAFVPKAGK